MPPRAINIRGLARLITGIESRDSVALRELAKLQSASRQVSKSASQYVIGVTGPPGAGKSTIVDGMIKRLREGGSRVGVVAIDPSSPFSGGALLGDRIRMQGHAGDSDVFIRSVGSRGSHGGLSRATRDIVRAFLAYGFDYVIVETVGVGQTELSIMEIADVTIVVLVPESGDMIQTMKAGLLEIADIFVVNKADRPGADQMQQWLASMFDTGVGLDAEAMAHHKDVIPPNPPLEKGGVGGFEGVPILLTQANMGVGIDDLMSEIEGRLRAIKGDRGHEEHKKEMLKQEFFEMCAEEFKSRLEAAAEKNTGLKKLLADVAGGRLSPYDGLKVVDKLVRFKK